MKTSNLDIFTPDQSVSLELPFSELGVVAGFPSPAEDYLESKLDLNRELVKHPHATFFARARGSSMRDAGIAEGDILVIDRSLTLAQGRIAVCFLDGNFTVKFVRKNGNRMWLEAANPSFAPIDIGPSNEFLVWGIVTYIIKQAP